MYICLCQAVTEKQIKAAAEGGAEKVSDLKRLLAVGTVCGKCVCVAQSVLDDALQTDESMYTQVA